jgi:hypothetical protein
MKKKTFPIAQWLVLFGKELDMCRLSVLLMGLRSVKDAWLGNDNDIGSDSASVKRDKSNLLYFSTFSFYFWAISKL